MKAGAAEERVLLDDGHLQAELSRADSGDIATRPAADDDEIVLLFCHGTSGMCALGAARIICR